MDHLKELAIATAKIAVTWVGVWLGHALDSITLSNFAFTASIIYSVVHTIATLKGMRRGE